MATAANRRAPVSREAERRSRACCALFGVCTCGLIVLLLALTIGFAVSAHRHRGAVVSGACCRPDEPCAVVADAASCGGGGTFYGAGTICAADTCSVRPAACMYDSASFVPTLSVVRVDAGASAANEFVLRNMLGDECAFQPPLPLLVALRFIGGDGDADDDDDDDEPQRILSLEAFGANCTTGDPDEGRALCELRLPTTTAAVVRVATTVNGGLVKATAASVAADCSDSACVDDEPPSFRVETRVDADCSPSFDTGGCCVDTNPVDGNANEGMCLEHATQAQCDELTAHFRRAGFPETGSLPVIVDVTCAERPCDTSTRDYCVAMLFEATRANPACTQTIHPQLLATFSPSGSPQAIVAPDAVCNAATGLCETPP